MGAIMLNFSEIGKYKLITLILTVIITLSIWCKTSYIVYRHPSSCNSQWALLGMQECRGL